MESKKINQLATEMAPVATDLTIIGDPITGVSKKITLLQLSATIGAGADLQQVTDNGATTTNPIAIGGLTITGLATGVLKSDSGVISSVPFGAANGVATLGGDGKVPSIQLPSYVDDVVEVANFAALPATGETGKIYITLDNNKVYRWTGSIYVEIAANNAVWGAITGTLSNQTDLQNALNAKVPYTGATANVDLGTFDLTADVITGATGSFASSGGSDTFAINHSSGSGVALNITKGGNNEGLYINKTSGSGNAATIIGTLNATTLVKSGGTSSQFLKADGSVDSNSYVTLDTTQTITASKTFSQNPVINGTGTNSAYTILQSDGTNKWRIGNNYAAGVNTFDIFAYDNSSTPLSINSNGAMTLSANVTTTGAQFVQNGFYLTNANGGSLAGYTHMWARNEGINFGLRNGTGGASFIFPSANSYNYTFPAASGTLALSSDLGAYLPLTGGTLTGALNGTSATFSSNEGLVINPSSGASHNTYKIGGTSYGLIGIAGSTNDLINGSALGDLNIRATNSQKILFSTNNGGSAAFTIASTGAATFSSSVTAGGAGAFTAAANGSPTLTLGTAGAVNAVINTADEMFFNIDSDNNQTEASFIFATNRTGTSGGSELVRFKDNGNVGIGTSSPSALLSLAKSLGNDVLTMGEDATSVRFKMGQEASYTGNYINSTNIDLKLQAYLAGGSGGNIIFQTGASGSGSLAERMRITSGGNVGIGTSSPNGFLQVSSENSGNTQMLLVRNFATSATGAFTGNYTAEIRGASNSNLQHAMLIHLNENNSSRRILDVTSSVGTVASFLSNGNVGIGTSSPNDKFVVDGGNNIWSGVFRGTTTTSQSFGVQIFGGTNSSDTAFRILNGATTSTYFFVRGDGFVNAGTFTYNNAVTGRAMVVESGGGLGYLVSTRESKDNIQSIKNVDFINKLNPVSFNYRKKNDVTNQFTDELYENINYGFIADEVEKVNKELVFYKEDGSLAGVEYNNMIAILTKAVQELKQEIEILKNK